MALAPGGLFRFAEGMVPHVVSRATHRGDRHAFPRGENDTKGSRKSRKSRSSRTRWGKRKLVNRAIQFFKEGWTHFGREEISSEGLLAQFVPGEVISRAKRLLHEWREFATNKEKATKIAVNIIFSF